MALEFKYVFAGEGVWPFEIKAYAGVNLFAKGVQKRAIVGIPKYALVTT
jgi:hypothetical protein